MNDTSPSLDQAEAYDAHETLRPNEPPFTVQGGDPLGPQAVQFWADLARSTGRAILRGATVRVEIEFKIVGEDDAFTPSEAQMVEADSLFRKASAAEKVVWAMQDYQRGDGEVDDAPHYSSDLGEDAAAALDARKALIKMSGALHNGLAIAFEVAERLTAMNQHPEQDVAIREACETLRIAAGTIDPRKGNERS